MITSYWDLYVAYIDKCVRDNWANDIDPAHYEMEWNHFLPKCVFGDWPIGQWLTKRQHAIASALQTLTFERRCMFGWHKQYLPEYLLELAWPYYRAACKTIAQQTANDKIGCHASEHKGKGGKKTHELKNEDGKSIHGVNMAERLHKEKDENGKSVIAVKSGKKRAKSLNEVKDEEGKSVNAVKGGKKGGKKGAETTTGQIWESLIDGFRSSPGPVAIHNKAKGWDPSARVRIK